VGRHDWAATAWWSVEGRQPGWSLRYTNLTFFAPVTVTASRDLGVPPGFPLNVERQVRAGLAVSVPWSSYERSITLTAAVDLTNYAWSSGPRDPAPPDGLSASVALQLSYSDARSFVRSISAEEGQTATVTFRLADPAFGSAFAFRQLTGAVARYLRLPFQLGDRPLHHVLGLRLSGGVARGDLSERHLFGLGGLGASDWIGSLLSTSAAPVRILRGFVQGAFAGESYLLGTAEYRLPIWDVETGAWTLPVYFRRLHAALFADAGDAFTVRLRDFQLHAGAGAELRAELLLGWSVPTNLRVGCAQGLTRSPWATLDCYGVLGGIF
jgi:hypothetical protein